MAGKGVPNFDGGCKDAMPGFQEGLGLVGSSQTCFTDAAVLATHEYYFAISHMKGGHISRVELVADVRRLSCACLKIRLTNILPGARLSKHHF